MNTKHIKTIISRVLTILFPFKELNDRPSVFVQNSWIEKVMMPTQVKDYLWVPTKY